MEFQHSMFVHLMEKLIKRQRNTHEQKTFFHQRFKKGSAIKGKFFSFFAFNFLITTNILIFR